MLRASVIISTLARPWFIKACLDTILQNELKPYEIIVVDQSEGNETEKIIRSIRPRYPALVYLRDEGKGASRAKNIAIKQSHSDLLAFTDDDCLSSPKWLLNASSQFKEKTELACLVGRVVRGRSLADISEKATKKIWEISGKADPWRLGPSGGNLFIRKEVFKQIGGFDESLGPGSIFRSAEDADLIYRVLKLGLLIQYNPDVLIVHRIWRSEKEDLEKRYGYGLGVGAFLAKYLSFSDPFPLYLFFRRFYKKPLKFLLGLILLRREMLLDGYFWSKGIIQGFWAWKIKRWERWS